MVDMTLEEVYATKRHKILRRLHRFCDDLSICEDALHNGYIGCMARNHNNLFTESYWALDKLKRYGKNFYDIDVEQVDNNTPENNLMLREQKEMLRGIIAVAPNHVKAKLLTDETYVTLAQRMQVSPITLRLKFNYHINKLRPTLDGFVEDKMVTNFVDKDGEIW
jgi:hypothetical protein